MIQSMTGYGKSVTELPGKMLHIELKSLNSKQADIGVKLPYPLREMELEIRNILSQRLLRGKIDCLVFLEVQDLNQAAAINQEAVKNYYLQLKNIMSELGMEGNEQVLPVIMRFPETLKTPDNEMDPEEVQLVKSGLDQAIDMLLQHRLSEGNSMEKDIRSRTSRIVRLLEKIQEFETGRITRIRERISKNIGENLPENLADKNRFEQEIIYYLEKLDFSEEKTRLRSHCDYFLEMIASNEPNGKKLGFIAQEIGREVNTLGAKANDADIQKLVVQMKDELEKIREQLANIL